MRCKTKKGGCMDREKAAKIKELLFISLADSKKGQELAAGIALEARLSLLRQNPTPTIVELSKALGVSNPLKTAAKIIAYMYPRKRKDEWHEYDNAYFSRVVHSGWIFPLLKGGKYESQKNA
jgi:hypothetical protein